MIIVIQQINELLKQPLQNLLYEKISQIGYDLNSIRDKEFGQPDNRDSSYRISEFIASSEKYSCLL